MWWSSIVPGLSPTLHFIFTDTKRAQRGGEIGDGVCLQWCHKRLWMLILIAPCNPSTVEPLHYRQTLGRHGVSCKWSTLNSELVLHTSLSTWLEMCPCFRGTFYYNNYYIILYTGSSFETRSYLHWPPLPPPTHYMDAYTYCGHNRTVPMHGH